MIVASGDAKTLKMMLGDAGTLVSDRASALEFWAMHRRQICSAQLPRKFVLFSERGGKSKTLDDVKSMFDYMVPIRARVEALLEQGEAAKIKGLSGSCKDILEHRAALWAFVDRDDLTNNHGERELRAFVLWRKTSQGTQSERGNKFAERMMTVTQTARKQNKNVFDFVVATYTAAVAGTQRPSLFS